MTIKKLVKFIQIEIERLEKLYNTPLSSENGVLRHTVKLSEEVGELAEQVLAYISHQRKEKLNKMNRESLAQEFADVIIVTCILANAVNVDIEKSLKNKIEKINKRYEK